jgi:hypothetical protein
MSIKWVVAVLVVVGVLLSLYYSQGLYRQFKAEAIKGLERIGMLEDETITEEDTAHLPEPVQKYLRYVGVIGREKVRGYRVSIDGSMKTDRERDWADVKVQQYSFTDRITRLFYLDLKMFGMPVLGLHSYIDTKATMLVKVAGLIPVVDGKGKEMNQGETVTVFNDMCIMAPAGLIDKRIEWEPVDSLTAKATFNNGDIKISAVLYFNEKGQLVNFVSDDRFYSPTGKTYERVRWSTPVSDYRDINGFNLASYGEAVWHFPEGDFCYARFNIKDIEYNPERLR